MPSLAASDCSAFGVTSLTAVVSDRCGLDSGEEWSSEESLAPVLDAEKLLSLSEDDSPMTKLGFWPCLCFV